ncbi:MAG TPA: CRTAC1 family protein, partial [Candidatus Latescibacteria bacterium]|nr:CRTAC1 family protein [Candidatus Latescibacterota bacterium]
DYDNDGDMDIAVSNSNGRSHLLQNQGGHNNHWLGLQLLRGKSNRDALGARVTVKFGHRQTHQQVRRARSYLSSSDARLLFGLGSKDEVDSVKIEWPDGTVQMLGRTKADRYLVVHASDGQNP